MFELVSPFRITPPQKKAAKKLTSGIKRGDQHQTLLGVTGCGKTFVMANVIEKVNKPTLVISPNKTLAAQLFEEFKRFFPNNAVCYFVSYYDYYQPEAYIPQTDTYIKKDAKINKEIDRLRHEAIQSLLQRREVIIVASVSAIYNLGSPHTYQKLKLQLKKGQQITRREILERLVDLQYQRNDYEFEPGIFRVRSEFIEVWDSSGRFIFRIKNKGKKILQLVKIQAPFGQETKVESIPLWPAKFWLTPKQKLNVSLSNIRLELQERVKQLKKEEKILEAQRLKKRTQYDLSLIRETGWCHGIENYSRHLEFREPREPPFVLLDYFPEDYLIFLDESHIGVPQIRGMYHGDRSRKKALVKHGFRLPSCLDNRPLKFKEFLEKAGQIVYVSATPSEFEKEKSSQVVEQLIRPTGLLDPDIEVRPTKNQVQDVVAQVKKRAKAGQRVLVTTLTKRLAEAIAKHLSESGVKATFLHSEIKTLKRPKILAGLRKGKYDVVVGINLLREGLDLPEVSLVVVLDADKEGFLRDRTSLIQVMGRAARHTEGHVIMYADKITKSMNQAIEEVKRRRKSQKKYNQKHDITPAPIKKKIEATLPSEEVSEEEVSGDISQEYLKELKYKLELAQRNLQFEKAARIQQKIQSFKTSS